MTHEITYMPQYLVGDQTTVVSHLSPLLSPAENRSMTQDKVLCTAAFSTVHVLVELLRRDQAAGFTYEILLHVFDEREMRVTRHLHHINQHQKTTDVTSMVRRMARAGAFSSP